MKLEEGIFSFTPRFAYSRAEILRELIANNEFFRFVYQYHDQELDITIAPSARYPEKERMYRYYHKVILPAAIKGFTAQGYEAMDKIKADYKLKAECAVGTMVKNGKEEAYLEDKAAMSKDRLHRFMNDCIQFIESELDEEVIGADEFKTLNETGVKLKSIRGMK